MVNVFRYLNKKDKNSILKYTAEYNFKVCYYILEKNIEEEILWKKFQT